MAKRGLSAQEYERESADVMERVINDERAFAAVADPEAWEEFISNVVTGGAGLSGAQMDFFEDTRKRILDSIEDSPFQMETFENRQGDEAARFRDTKTGRFTAFGQVKDFVSGLLKGFR